jgi:hypothetical protein
MLRLQYMNVTGQVPAPDWSLPRTGLTNVALRYLPQVSGNLAGLLDWLSGSPQLSKLYLTNWGPVTNNSAQQPVLEALPTSFPNLDTLELTGLGLSGTLPASWWRLYDAPAKSVSLDNNQLRGSIPAAWIADAGAPTTRPTNLTTASFA